MALNGSDALPISRAGSNYKILGSDILAYIQSNIGTSEYRVADLAARNALNAQLSAGDRVMVDDAAADATVSAGWALYQWLGSNTWRKIAEQEGIDVGFGGATNLTYTPGATQGIVVSDSGADAILPSVDGTNAGLMLPAHKAKLDFFSVSAAFNADAATAKLAWITVTQAVNLDALKTTSHEAVTTAGSTATNPIVVNGQELSFNIAGLAVAP